MYKLQNEKHPKKNSVGTILKYHSDGTILKYHSDATILKYHRKLTETEEKSIPLTHIHLLTHFHWVKTPACRMYIVLILTYKRRYQI